MNSFDRTRPAADHLESNKLAQEHGEQHAALTPYLPDQVITETTEASSATLIKRIYFSNFTDQKQQTKAKQKDGAWA